MTKARDIASAAPAPSTVSATELGYLDGVTSAVQTQLNAKQAVVSGVNDTEIGYLDGVTSAIQTQLDAKTAKSTLTTTGDIYYASSANTPARLGIGSTGNVLTVASGIPSWSAPASGGGMTSIASGSLSGSSLVLSSISGSYNDLFLVLRDATFTQNSEVQVRINNNSGSVYDQLGLNVTTSTFVGYGSQNATISGVTYYATSSQGNYVLSSRFIDYAKTTTRKQIQHQASYTRHDNAGQETTVKFDTVRDSNAITRVDVILTNASFTGGTYILYGVK